MSEQTLGPPALSNDEKPATKALSISDILWTVAQPVLVLGSMFLLATMVTGDWMNHELYALIMIMLPIPLLMFAERIWAKQKGWILQPRELAEDGFWIAFGVFLWGPLISGFYRTPISEGFRAIRDRSPLDITLAPESILGLVGATLLLRICSSFIYYWLHRVQHESLFFWRMHATHHHITKMRCMAVHVVTRWNTLR